MSFTTVGATPDTAKFAASAAKGQEEGTEHIESGQAGSKQGDEIQGIITMFVGKSNDGIFTEEAGKEGETGNRETSDQPGRGGNRHEFCQPTHLAHVLYLFMRRMVQGLNHATSAQEEQGFEEGMGEKVEHTRAGAILYSRNTQTDEHVAKLADSRESQYTFEVALAKSNQSGENSGDAANPGNGLERGGVGGGKQRECASHHVDTGGHHRRRMDEGADGRWPFHCGRQPDMQRHLRGFTDSTTKHQNHGKSQEASIAREGMYNSLCAGL